MKALEMSTIAPAFFSGSVLYVAFRAMNIPWGIQVAAMMVLGIVGTCVIMWLDGEFSSEEEE